MSIEPARDPGHRRYRTFRVITALILREIVTRYGRSPGGYLWAIIEPVMGIVILSLVFAMVSRSPPLGTNFPLFFATGILVFQHYVMVSSLLASAIRFSRPLLAYPAVTFMDAVVARLVLGSLTQFLVMALVLSGIIGLHGLKPIIDRGAILNAVAMATALGAGVGMINCYLFAVVPIWERTWSILNRPMFILSGILFMPENVPARWRDLYMINPLPHITSDMRRGFYATYEGSCAEPLYVWIISVVLIVIGMILLLRNHKFIAQL